MKKRHHNRRRLRFFALVLVVLSMIFVGTWFINGLYDLDWSWQSSELSFALALLPPAILMWVFDQKLARLLVPLPQNRCPQCSYNLTALTRPNCPECGLPIPKVFVQEPPSPGSTTSSSRNG